ncbi:MAG: macrolide family glycosyltransferase [Anaerolineae bacterium]
MSKAIFFNIPASGHVNPSLELTAELVRRGEQMIYYNTEHYRKLIEATGATFRPYTHIDDSYFGAPPMDGSNPPLAAERIITTTRDALPGLIDLVRAEQPDYLLYDSMCPWGALVGRVLGLPSVTSLALWVMTPAMMMRQVKPSMLVKAVREMAGMMINGMPHILRFNQVSRAIGKAYGIKPLAFTEAFNAPADLVISYTSATFQLDSDKLDKRIQFVGPMVAPRGDAPPFPLEQLDGKRVIYISLGTLINTNLQFFKDCFAAFGDTPYTVVMAIGSRLKVEALGAIPSNFIVRPYVPQTEILKRAVLFISHGGMNSVHDALYWNVPLLVVPQQSEQTFTARRVVDFGAGLQLDAPTPETLRQSAERVLNDPGFRQRAEALGGTLREAGGAARAADLVQEMVRAKASEK